MKIIEALDYDAAAFKAWCGEDECPAPWTWEELETDTGWERDRLRTSCRVSQVDVLVAVGLRPARQSDDERRDAIYSAAYRLWGEQIEADVFDEDDDEDE